MRHSTYSSKPTYYQQGILCKNGFSSPEWRVERDTPAEMQVVSGRTGDRYVLPKWKVDPRKLW